MKLTIYLIILFCWNSFNFAYAWEETGHDLITRVATRLLQQRVGSDRAKIQLFIHKEHQLSHYSNVPDIVYRWLSPEITRQGNIMHFFNLDKGPEVLSKLPPLSENTPFGALPYQVENLFNQLVSALKNPTPAHLKEGLLFAGLISHFVGDAANPHHATKDFNGFLSGQGCMHRYFETLLVNEYPHTLIAEVQRYAEQQKPWDQIMKKHSLKGKSSGELVFYLLKNSLGEKKRLFDLDLKYAVIKKSEKRSCALRHPPAEVKKHFKQFIIERLALGADTLGFIWYLSWKNAGKPDLGDGLRFDYQVKPAFIPLFQESKKE